MCCLRSSANVSYQHAEEDMEMFTGIRVSAKTQQRLVHRQTFDSPKAEQPVEELSVDGGAHSHPHSPWGKIAPGKNTRRCISRMQRLGRSSKIMSPCQSWVNTQPLASPVTCLGDGHDGVWNIIVEITPNGERREILDWYQMIENLHLCGRVIETVEASWSFAMSGTSWCNYGAFCWFHL